MPLKYKIDILAALKSKGYSSYRLVNEKIFGNGSIQKLRKGEVLSTEGLETLCRLLDAQPADLIVYIPDDHNTSIFFPLDYKPK